MKNSKKRIEEFFPKKLWEPNTINQFNNHLSKNPKYITTLYPHTTEEVKSIITYCNQYKIKVVQIQQNFSGSLKDKFIIISFDKMKSIEMIEEDQVLVEAGIKVKDLLDFLEFKQKNIPVLNKFKHHTLLDILNSNILNYTTIYPYGFLSSYVISLECVLGSGEIIPLSYSSYIGEYLNSIRQIFLNTYGNYSIITRVKLKLRPYLKYKAMVSFYTSLFASGQNILKNIKENFVSIENIIFFDQLSVEKLQEWGHLQFSLEEIPFLFLIEVVDSSLEGILQKIKNIEDILIKSSDILLYESITDQNIFYQYQLLKHNLEVGVGNVLYNYRIEECYLSMSKFEEFFSDLNYIKQDFGIEFFITGSLQDNIIQIIFANIEDETGFIWNSFQHEIRCKILDTLKMYFGSPTYYYAQEQGSIENFFEATQLLLINDQIKKNCDPNSILISSNYI